VCSSQFKKAPIIGAAPCCRSFRPSILRRRSAPPYPLTRTDTARDAAIKQRTVPAPLRIGYSAELCGSPRRKINLADILAARRRRFARRSHRAGNLP
jgi:hypothetical protein